MYARIADRVRSRLYGFRSMRGLLTCPQCAGLWSGVICGYFLGVRSWEGLLSALGCSGFCMLVDAVYCRIIGLDPDIPSREAGSRWRSPDSLLVVTVLDSTALYVEFQGAYGPEFVTARRFGTLFPIRSL